MSNQVTLTFAGDEKDLNRAFDSVGDAARGMGKEVERSAESFDKVGEGAGILDQRAMGFRDAITGATDFRLALKGVDEAGNKMSSPERLLMLGMGVGDLASAVENLAAPLAKQAALWVKHHAKMAATTVANTAKIAAAWAANAARATASVVKAVAVQTVQWAVLAVKSLAAAAQVALAWLISMGPILLVGAAVIALVILIVKNWDTIKEVISKGWDFVKDKSMAFWSWLKGASKTALEFVKGLFDEYVGKYVAAFGLFRTAAVAVWNKVWDKTKEIWAGIKGAVGNELDNIRTRISRSAETIKGIFSTIVTAATRIFKGLTGALVNPFGAAASGVKAAWNRILGGKGFTIPDWVPGIGGNSYTIPRLAKGGIIKPRTGGTPFIGGEAGQHEAVIPLPNGPRGLMGGGVTMYITVMGSIRSDRELSGVIADTLRTRGLDTLIQEVQAG